MPEPKPKFRTDLLWILDALERVLRDVRRVTIADASHPMNHGNAAVFDAAVLEFLASCEA